MNRSAVIVLVLTLFAAVPLAQATEIPFEQSLVSIDLSSGVRLTTGDMDGDGDADLVTTRSLLGSDAEWWENDGSDDPDWIRRTIGPAGSIVNVADVDSDGDQDLFAVGFPFASWFDNDGSNPPVWTQRTIDGTEVGLRSIAPVDLNGDGHLDAVGANQSQNAVRWYENDGATPPVWTTRTIDGALADVRHVEVGDFNADGHADVVAITESPGQLVWYENDGAAVPGFTTRVIAAFGGPGWQCKVADLDGDGDLDVVTSQPPPLSDVTWYENDGASPPGWTARIIDNNGSFVPQDLVVIDFDLDGDIDVASISSTDDKVRWHENDGSSPPLWTNRTVTFEADNPNDLTAGDFDGDGDVDLATLSTGDSELAIYENRTIHRNATLPNQTIIDTIAVFLDLSVTIADLDGDGDGDVVSGANATTWHENLDGAGTSWQSATILTHFNRAGDSTVADLDRDGDLDVLACDIQSGQIDWAENTTGDGSAWTVNTIPHLGAECYSIAVEDIDGDGDPDVVTTMVSDRVSWHENTAGDASAWSEHLIDLHPFNLDALPIDVDHDGDIDVVNTTTTGAVWYENSSGDGSTWSAAQAVGLLGGSHFSLAHGDMDRDGDLDVLLASDDLDTIEWYENALEELSFKAA